MRWLRNLLRQPEPPQWVISTPYGTMSGEGLPPMNVFADIKRQGIQVEVVVDRSTQQRER